MSLTITQREHGKRTVLVLEGDLDYVTAPQLTEAADALMSADGQIDLILEADQLAFCDSSGLAAFVRIAQRLAGDGGRLAIAGPTPIVRRVLALSGLEEAVIVADDVESATLSLAG
jgi:anti-anti-sigma factor